MNIDPSIFRAYDIRGIYPDTINEDIVYKIAQAYVWYVRPENVVVGHDVRLSGPTLAKAAINGFIDAGVNVIDIGEISTDMMYFTVANYGYDGGITISASHNPREFNGVKMVRKSAIPIAGDSGIPQMRDFVLSNQTLPKDKLGRIEKKDILDDYCRKILSFIQIPILKNYRIVANANFGMAGIALKRLIELGDLPISLTELNFTPDGSFPKGRPDPMIPELRIETEDKVKEINASFGVAWDGDADRIFFYDESGWAMPGVFTTIVLAKYFLEKFPGSKIYCDPRLTLAAEQIIPSLGGQLVVTPAGHSFIKEQMREQNIVFGGEATGHYYFRDYFYADCGMIPFVIMLQMLEKVEKISELYQDLFTKYFVVDEIDFEVSDAAKVLQTIHDKFEGSGKLISIDGYTFEYPEYRFNIRASNTEPLVRLNVEGYDKVLVNAKAKELSDYINSIKDIS